MGRACLVLLLAVAMLPVGSAQPPMLFTWKSPEQGKLNFDPILYYSVLYTEPGSTDCFTDTFNSCVVEGPGQNAHWVRVEIVGHANASFFLDNVVTKKTLLSAACEPTSPARTECIFPLAVPQSSSDFRMQVRWTTGSAGSFVAVYLEAGATIEGQRL